MTSVLHSIVRELSQHNHLQPATNQHILVLHMPDIAAFILTLVFTACDCMHAE